MKKSTDKVFVIQGEASESEDDEKVVLSVVCYCIWLIQAKPYHSIIKSMLVLIIQSIIKGAFMYNTLIVGLNFQETSHL